MNFHKEIQGDIAFVPTMGALHQGHFTLVQSAQLQCQQVVVSIFVNPLQFNNPEDLERYPRTIASDLKHLHDLGVFAVIIPDSDEVYPHNDVFQSAPAGTMALGLEGDFRPGHFDGVVNVVDRLFHWIQPNVVVFGQKDLQQCLVIKELIDLKYPQIQFHMVPTVRESNGLAMSSRNIRLSNAAKVAAGSIYQTLSALTENRITTAEAEIQLNNKNIEVEYLTTLRMKSVDSAEIKAWVFAGYLEGVRLIDNVLIP